MWIKLTGEYLNLHHIVRVKTSRTFKHGEPEWVVDLEGIVKGELTYFSRYRGVDAEIVMHALEIHSRLEPAPTSGIEAPSRGTVHDVKIM
jgi:hypothetical protein